MPEAGHSLSCDGGDEIVFEVLPCVRVDTLRVEMPRQSDPSKMKVVSTHVHVGWGESVLLGSLPWDAMVVLELSNGSKVKRKYSIVTFAHLPLRMFLFQGEHPQNGSERQRARTIRRLWGRVQRQAAECHGGVGWHEHTTASLAHSTFPVFLANHRYLVVRCIRGC